MPSEKGDSEHGLGQMEKTFHIRIDDRHQNPDKRQNDGRQIGSQYQKKCAKTQNAHENDCFTEFEVTCSQWPIPCSFYQSVVITVSNVIHDTSSGSDKSGTQGKHQKKMPAGPTGRSKPERGQGGPE